MSDTKKAAPLLDGFAIGAAMSNHDGVRCYPALKENTQEKYIIKTISIPASQVQLDALLLTGAYKDPADAMDYFKDVSDGVIREAEILQALSKLDGFLPYESYQILPQEEGQLGYVVCLAGTYKRSLEKYMRRTVMTHLEAVNLGLDLCQALSICRRAGYLYVDLKPGNVFISREKEYRIGDLGFVELNALDRTSLPAKYSSAYSAPEVRDALKTLNDTVDTYAVGMILYQIYNDGVLTPLPAHPQDPFPSPVNADYEIAEIILKAIAPDPKDRWKDPMEMGQALVSYMQRNAINNTPIAPNAALNTEGVSLDQTQAFPIPPEYREENKHDSPPEHAPEHALEPAEPEMPAPEPEVPELPPIEEETEAAEPVEVEEASNEEESPVSEETPTPADIPVSIPVEEPKSEPVDEEEEALFDLSAPVAEEAPAEEPETPKPQAPKVQRVRKKRSRNWIVPLLTIVILALLGFCGFLFYQGYYLQTIQDLTIDGSQNSLTVHVKTTMDQGKLTVLCSDTYGNTKTSSLTDGKAEFTDLLPNSQYKIQLQVEGFHKLTGKTTELFNTDAHTNIVGMTAAPGVEEGSLSITITVDGAEPEEWILSYGSEGEVLQSQTFSGNNVTVRGLTLGVPYSFQLSTIEDIYLTGMISAEFTAEKNVIAENLHVSAYSDSGMTIRWTCPKDTVVEKWTVRCYDNNGKEQIQEVTGTEATFADLDVTQDYTIEVLAGGMALPARTTITANPITVTSLTVDDSQPDMLKVSWEHDGDAPEGGWLLMYTLDGGDIPEVIKCENATAEISPRIHGATYKFVIQAANSTSIFDNIHAYICPTPDVFSTQGLSADKITGYLLKTPAASDWTYESIDDEQITDTFTLGNPLSMVLKANANFYLAAEEISVLYVFRDGRGNVLPELTRTDLLNWTDIWYAGDYHVGEIDIPTAPDAPGEYSLCLYFNGKSVLLIEFTITE